MAHGCPLPHKLQSRTSGARRNHARWGPPGKRTQDPAFQAPKRQGGKLTILWSYAALLPAGTLVNTSPLPGQTAPTSAPPASLSLPQPLPASRARRLRREPPSSWHERPLPRRAGTGSGARSGPRGRGRAAEGRRGRAGSSCVAAW